jgi:hypothetical protein
MADIIQHKRGTAANWTVANTILASGQIGIETDTRKTKVGDGVTAWNSLAYAWEITVGSQDLWIGAAAMWPTTTGGCADITKTELATSLVNIQSLDFDQTTEEKAQVVLSLPRNWNNGTVTAKFYWTAASGVGDVVWGIKGGAYSNDDPLTTALGTEVEVTDTLIAANDLHISSVSAAVTLAGSPADADFLAFQIARKAAAAGDTLTADAKLLGVVITITTDAATA